NFLVPKGIDGPAGVPWPQAVVANLALIGLFAVQHSVMARPAFKEYWTRYIPKPIERSTYVLLANLVVMLLVWQWQPIDTVVWSVSPGPVYYVLIGLFLIGFLLVPTVSLMINHFDLFGLRQTWLNLKGRAYTSLAFRTPMLYAHVRHPLYIG